MAESAVNQVISARMCKCQQMQWTPRGAHLLAQVRCAAINGDLATKLAAYRARIDEVPRMGTAFLCSCSGRQKLSPTIFNSPVPY